ncbi:hypothetical protein [Streptomyces sp. NBC_00038]|uniref:hypothetical protein n=1 Tax=Streptomyces sp. NBC_00038 TaxID=2903615 RepID=UPI002251F5C2|nr:hypothetical protein [Streptomyces sp. NBC_00038]MCX5562755.1 hypothetical protein [Streptomyces sp. NBC_00038]MCX5563595.1 hypothetical protein [Streptomyces sp. NBC_00038]
MSAAVTPTIGGRHPGFGLRVRKDGNRALAVADADCPCGKFSEAASGDVDVEALVIRYGRHRRDQCSNPVIRAVAARQYAALQQSLNKRRK